MTIDELNEWLEFKIDFTQEAIDKSKEQETEHWKMFMAQKKAFEEIYAELNGNTLIS